MIQPRFVGDAVGLSATLTFLSLIFWGWVLGPLGALLAVPMPPLAKALLIDNLDPMEEKKKAKLAAQRASLLFETVALEWHAEMSRRWMEGHAKTVMSRLHTHVFPLIGQRPIAELDTHDLLVEDSCDGWIVWKLRTESLELCGED